MARSKEDTIRDYSKRWVFTWNNYTKETEELLKEFSNECEWLIYGHEIAPDTGTKHLQGFIHLKKRVHGSYLINKLKGAWINKAAGNNEQNEKYTKKEGDYIEYGSKPMTGPEKNAVKWKRTRECAVSGKYDDIPDDIFIKHVRNIEYIHNMSWECPKDHFDDWTNKDLKEHRLWLWGPSDTGKTHHAILTARKLGCPDYYEKGRHKWWNNFKGQKVTIMDEISPKQSEFLAEYFKNWLDKKAFEPELKGSMPTSKYFCEYFIITSNYSIDECFPNPVDADAIRRRCTEYHMVKKYEPFAWPPNVSSDQEEHHGTMEHHPI